MGFGKLIIYNYAIMYNSFQVLVCLRAPSSVRPILTGIRMNLAGRGRKNQTGRPAERRKGGGGYSRGEPENRE